MKCVGKTNKSKIFLPLKIKIYGEKTMENEQENVKIERVPAFQIIGFSKTFQFDSAYQEIPKFWNEIFTNYLQPVFRFGLFKNEIEQAILENKIGEFGVCIDENKNGEFTYLIAGKYMGGPVPTGMNVVSFPELEWAKFKVVGPMPTSLQNMNTKIFRDWLPHHLEYKIAKGYNIEWYSEKGRTTDDDYESAIWIPITKK